MTTTAVKIIEAYREGYDDGIERVLQILKNNEDVYGIGSQASMWTMDSIIENTIEQLREESEDK